MLTIGKEGPEISCFRIYAMRTAVVTGHCVYKTARPKRAGRATIYRLDGPGFELRQGQKILFSLNRPGTALGPTHHSIYSVGTMIVSPVSLLPPRPRGVHWDIFTFTFGSTFV